MPVRKRTVLRAAALVASLLTLPTACGEPAAEARADGAVPDSVAAPLAASLAGLDTTMLAPSGVRVRVEIHNGAGITGLARRGMQWARDLGYDVVDFDNADGPVAATRIERHQGGDAIAQRLARAFGDSTAVTVTVAERPSPYVDYVVLLGPDWRPPAQPFRP